MCNLITRTIIISNGPNNNSFQIIKKDIYYCHITAFKMLTERKRSAKCSPSPFFPPRKSFPPENWLPKICYIENCSPSVKVSPRKLAEKLSPEQLFRKNSPRKITSTPHALKNWFDSFFAVVVIILQL